MILIDVILKPLCLEGLYHENFSKHLAVETPDGLWALEGSQESI